MARANAILAAVQYIHEAPLASDGWMRALPAIADVVRSEHAFLLVQDAGSRAVERIIGNDVAPQHLAAFAAAVSAGMPAWAPSLPVGMVTPSSTMMPDSEFMLSVFYNEAIRPMGSFYGLAVAPLRSHGRHVYVTTGRRLGRENYDAQDVAAMQALVPHIVTALRVSDRLSWADQRAAGVNAALDRMHAGVILVDATARILFANQTADALLAGNDGFCTDGERICARGHHATGVLRRLIRNCVDITMVTGGSMEIPRAEGRRPLYIVVAPFRRAAAQMETTWLGAAQPVAILMVTDPEREQRIRKEDLRRRFGLTPAEADVAVEILRGDGRDASAARLGIATTTVRTHLSHIFEKTGARRQAELIRLLLRGARN